MSIFEAFSKIYNLTLYKKTISDPIYGQKQKDIM